MNKIGIVTWYDKGFNYGSTLQAFAMQSYIESKGYTCELINYKPEYKKVHNIFKEILKRLYLLICNYNLYKNWNKMEKWIKKNIKQSKLILNYEKLKQYSKKYDAVICGSDQIWSNSKNYVNPFYYLEFVDEKKRIAYAPSIGKNYIDESIKNEFSKHIKQIKYLSVREENGAQLIEKCTGRKAKVVIDPTLLINKLQWDELAKISDNRIEEQPYIFAYFLSENKEYYSQVQKIAKEKELKIVTTPMMYNKNYNKNTTVIRANPSEFLNLIKNANYIITDSFHGIAFSVNFEKEFIAYKRFEDTSKLSENSRIYNILQKLNLYDRLVTKENTIDKIISENIDYSKVQQNLDTIIKDSKIYLNQSIKDITNKVD